MENWSGEKYTLFQEMASEFVGTLVLILFGSGVVAATLLFETNGVNDPLRSAAERVGFYSLAAPFPTFSK